MPIGKNDAAAAAAEAARRAAEKAREAARKAAEEAKAQAAKAAAAAAAKAAASAKTGVKAGLGAGIGKEASKRLGLKDRFSSKAMKPIRGGARAEAGLGAGLSAGLSAGASASVEAQPSFKPSQLQALSKNPAAAYLGSADNDVASIENAASKRITSATTELDEANAKVEANKAELNEQLRRLSPHLTEAQKKAYVQKFNEAHQGDVDKAKEAAQKAAQALQETRDAVPGPSVDEQLAIAKSLSKNPEGAKAAKDFVQELATNPDGPAYQQLVKSSGGVEAANKALQDTLKEAIPNLTLKGLEDSKGDPKAAAEFVKRELEALDTAKGIVGDVSQVAKAMDLLASGGDFKSLKDMGAGPYGDTLKVASTIIGIAKVANGTAQPQDVLSLTKDSAELTATALKSFGKVAGGELLEKLAAPLGVVAGIYSMSDDVKAIMKDGKNGDKLKLIGDALSTAGAVCACTGAGAPVGAILAVAGTALTVAGSIVNMKQEESDRSAEQLKLLKEIGVEENWAKVLSSNERFADPKFKTEWLGGSPADVRKKIADGPGDDARAYENLIELMNKFPNKSDGYNSSGNQTANEQFKKSLKNSPNLTDADREYLRRWEKNDKTAKAPPGFMERAKQAAQDFVNTKTASWGDANS